MESLDSVDNATLKSFDLIDKVKVKDFGIEIGEYGLINSPSKNKQLT